MTGIKGAGRISDIVCNECVLQEFPELLFGTRTDGESFFDATHFIQSKGMEATHTVSEFFKAFEFQINAITDSYNLSKSEIATINKEGHQLLIGYLCYPFISYIDPQFCAYTNELINDIFINGIAVSDSYLIQNVQKRIPPELIKQLTEK